MRRLLLFFLGIFLYSHGAKAQIEVKQGSFKEVAGFVNIDDKQHDDNGTPYAVIKVRTENITDKERRELNFDGGLSTSFELEYKEGEVWIYITYLASRLKISHPEFGSVSFVFPFEMKPKCGYEMLLVNNIKVVDAGWGSLSLSTKPENGATISINGKKLKVKTPYKNEMMAAGVYEITVSMDKYQTVTQIVEIKNGGNKTVEIVMPFAYGILNVVSEPAGANVFVDDVNCGTTPVVLKDIVTGQHEVMIKKNDYFQADFSVYVKEAEVKDIKAELQQLPEGALNGLFTINANGDKVVFSKGNLQYHPKEKIWRFAEHQWDFIGEDNVKRSRKYNGWVDLFGWGTGNSPTTTALDERVYFERPFCDWAEHKITNGGNEKNQWRTMTKSEWEYLLNERTTASEWRYAKAEVNGVIGVILLPDDWSSTCYEFKHAQNYYDSAPNKISLAEWENVFEIRGAVFLPAAGNHWGVNKYGVNRYDADTGYYWVMTSTDAYTVRFYDHIGVEVKKDIAFNGCSVRPAKDINR